MFTPYTMTISDYDGVAILTDITCQFMTRSAKAGNPESGHDFIEKCEIMTNSTLPGVSLGDFCVVTHEWGDSVGSWEIESITPKSLASGLHHNFIVGIKGK